MLKKRAAFTRPITPSRSTIHRSLRKRGVEESELGWKRTNTPTKGRYEASNLLGKGTLSNGHLKSITIIEINNQILEEPVSYVFRVKNVEELTLAIINKLELTFPPLLFFHNELENEDIEISDISMLPNPTKIKIRQKDEDLNYAAVLFHLKNHVTIQDRRYRLKWYRNCFIASELVDYVQKKEIIQGDLSREAALAYCCELQKLGYIQHVVHPQKLFKDKYLFFRFTEEAESEDQRCNISITTYSWGSHSSFPHMIEDPESIISVACGSTHTIALGSKGNVFSWGIGNQGQLGLGPTVTETKHPRKIPLHVASQAIYAGYQQSGAQCGDTEVFTWGCFTHDDFFQSSPTALELPPNCKNATDYIVEHVAFGYSHGAVLVSFFDENSSTLLNSVITYGKNDYGQLGIANVLDTTHTYHPTIVPELAGLKISSISCGHCFTGCLTSDGQVLLWGCNNDDWFGITSKRSSTPSAVLTPRRLRSVRSVSHFDCGSNFIACINNKGDLLILGEKKRLGSNNESQLKKISAAHLRSVSSVSITSLVCGENHLFLYSESSQENVIYAMGDNSHQQLGVNFVATVVTMPVPVQLPIDRIICIAAGNEVSSSVITEELLEIAIAAAQKTYGYKDKQQRRKLITVIASDPTGMMQISARKIIRLENSNNNIKKLKSIGFRGSNPSLNTLFDRQTHSSIYVIGISKYHIFGNSGTVNIYKYLGDEVILNHGGCSDSRFSIVLPTHDRGYELKAMPMNGEIWKENVAIQFQFIGRSPGTYEEIISIEIKGPQQSYVHFVYFQMECEAQVQVPEFRYKDLQGGEILGSGAGGTVTKLDLGGTDVAVKFFHGVETFTDEDINSFRNEMLICSNLSHPNIITCLGVCIDFPHLALVLEFLPLKDLRHLIEHQRGLLSTELILKITIDIVEGMIYLHDRMVVHGDLKPDNVLLVNTSHTAPVCAKLTDFGTSCTVSKKTKATTAGTARYMPLEVLVTQEGTYDMRKVDIYSFSIIVWELYSGEMPFQEASFTSEIIEILQQQGGHTLPFSEEWDIPESFKDILLQCLSSEPEKRPFFSDILLALIEICERFSQQMEKVASLLRAKYGYRKMNSIELKTYQIQAMDKKILKLNAKEKAATEKLLAIQQDITRIKLCKDNVEKTKNELVLELLEIKGNEESE